MQENKIICSECGAVLTNETSHEFEGKTFCSECLERVTTICECCGTRIWKSRRIFTYTMFLQIMA